MTTIDHHPRDDEQIKLALDIVNGAAEPLDMPQLVMLLRAALDDRLDILNECQLIIESLQDIHCGALVIDKNILTLDCVIEDFNRVITPPTLSEIPAFLLKQAP